jgi:AraC-like DNA-binding protein
MIFHSYKPAMLLDTYVEVIHLRHFIFLPGQSLPFKPYPPRPEQCITFYVRGYETTGYQKEGITIQRPRSTVSGQFTQLINRHTSPEFLMILVVFRPGALNRLTGIDFSELMDQAIDAEAIFGNDVEHLNNRLNSTDSYEEMIGLVNEFLIRRVKSSSTDMLPIDHAIQYYFQNPQSASVTNLSSLSCLSLRQLERRFMERIGISPKTFLKIVRFNRSYFLHMRQPHLSWSSLAVRCGYTDYQHMVKDYKEFTGTTMTLLFLNEEKAPERVLGLTQ